MPKGERLRGVRIYSPPWMFTLGLLLALGAACTDPPADDDAEITDLPINPGGPSLELDTDSLDFGEVSLGESSTLTFEVGNSSYGTLNATPTLLENASGQFSMDDDGVEIEVAEGEASILTIYFTPSIEGPQSGTLALTTNDEDFPSVSIALSGSGMNDDQDGDGYKGEVDCDDARDDVYPGAEELCDQIDNNCNEEIDEGLEIEQYLDADQDGFGALEGQESSCEKLDGYVESSSDCDDGNSEVYPGALEICDQEDDNCDGQVDEGLTLTLFPDSDQDGYGNEGDGLETCEITDGYVQVAGDCDDEDPAINPGAEEVCNSVDDNCDGLTDDLPKTVIYPDKDRDGYGDPSGELESCIVYEGFVETDGDCDDHNSDVFPGATEVCDELDNDCDLEVDEMVTAPFYPDADLDGYGVSEGAIQACTAPTGYSSVLEDCDDGNAEVYPGATEVCNGSDDNCNGEVDEGALDPALWYADADSDGYGNSAESVESCSPPDGYVASDTDCDDENPYTFPGAPEFCDGIDNDCDTELDEDAIDQSTFYFDGDSDGYGQESQTTESCDVPEGYVVQAGDCNDEDALYHPGAEESDCTDPNDYNCDGTVGYEDGDGDGFAACADCDDTNPYAAESDAEELCDGMDNNCNELVDEGVMTVYYFDGDGDGHGTNQEDVEACQPPEGYVESADDCDDDEASTYPGADELCDHSDNDCDGEVDEEALDLNTFYLDQDEDGYGVDSDTTAACDVPEGYAEYSGDCDDEDPRFHPNAEESDCTDPNDYNCDGSVGYVDDDGDGSAACEDCDDHSPDVFPGAVESCNDLDDNCDGTIDETDAVGCKMIYPDQDGDTYGDEGGSCECDLTLGYTTKPGDCDDLDSKVSPDGDEACNGYDDDCDGQIDEVDAEGCERFYADADGDAWGSTTDYACVCEAGELYSAVASGDCDDNDGEKYPGNLESCDGKDNNCSGEVDEGVKSTFYLDYDGDGFGASYNSKEACTAPDGYVSQGGDCNDYNSDIYPTSPEVCDDIDNNCNGQVDEGLSEVSVYVDLDGDGHGAEGTSGGQTCLVDEDGDGTGEAPPGGYSLANDDCDDSDATVYADAPEKCDGKDNDCDDLVDPLCFEECGGSWPFRMDYSYSTVQARPADLNGDGEWETIIQDNFGFAILNAKGEPLYNYSAPNHNYSRGTVVLADIDTYDQFGSDVQNVEVLTGNGSRPRFYKLESDKSITQYENTSVQVYDASRFMAADVDFDQHVEFYTTDWCSGTPGVSGFQFDRSSSTISELGTIDDPDGTCVYTNGRTISDLNDDGYAEIVFGNGYAYATNPNYWGGNIYAYEVADISTMDVFPYCEGDGCFPTALGELYGGGVGELFRVGNEIHSYVSYFYTNEPNEANSSVGYYWMYDLEGLPLEGYPDSASGLYYPTDVNDDGEAESVSAVVNKGLWDVNGDGYPDKFSTSGNELILFLWDESTESFREHTESRLSISSESVAFRGVWDYDSDGKINVIASDANGSAFCYELGEDTWNKESSLPPHFPLYLRTYQWDNYEPNDGADEDGDGIPDRVIQLASAMTRQGDFYSYISTPDDVDYYLLDTAYNGSICLQAPRDRNYRLRVFSFSDRWNNADHSPEADGLVDGEVWSGESGSGGNICFYSSRVTPARHGEYKFVVGIESVEGYSPYWPYWLEAAK